MIEERFDAIVVGAGMAGNAAALTLAQRGLKVLQLERGEYSGSKNVQGAILYADMLEKLIPDFREDAPLERHLVEQQRLCQQMAERKTEDVSRNEQLIEPQRHVREIRPGSNGDTQNDQQDQHSRPCQRRNGRR